MEFNLIPQIIIVFSIGVIIFIFGKNIPKIKETQNDDLLFEKENKEEKKKFSYLCGRLARRIKKDSYREKKDLIWKWLEKSLRKIRINFLKLDNKIVSVLEKLKKKSVNHDNNNSEFKVDDTKLEKSEIDESKDELQASKITSEEKNKDEDEIEKKEEKSDKEKEYIDLIFKSPKNIKAYWKLGIVYSRKKRYKDSISCFRQIIKIDPGYTKAKKKIVDLIRRMKKDKKVDEEK